jgi:hypothetical protein
MMTSRSKIRHLPRSQVVGEERRQRELTQLKPWINLSNNYNLRTMITSMNIIPSKTNIIKSQRPMYQSNKIKLNHL